MNCRQYVKAVVAVLAALLIFVPSARAASITFVNATSSQTALAASTIVLNVPTGVLNGDALVACVSTQTSAATVTFTAPGAFTLLQSGSQTSDPAKLQMSCYTRSASSEPASYTWTFSASTNASAFILDYRNVLSTGFLDTSAIGTGLSASVVAPGITTANANEYVISAFAVLGPSFTGVPSGQTVRASVTGMAQPQIIGADVFQAVAGPSGAKSVTAISTPWIAVNLAIIPSPAPPVPPITNVTVTGGINNFYGKPCVACHVDIYPLNPTGLTNLGSGGTLVEANQVSVETNSAGIFSASVVGSITAALYVEETNALMKFTLPSSGTLTLSQILAQQPNVVSTFPPTANLNMGGQRFINLSGGQAVGDSSAVGEGLEGGCQVVAASGNYPIPTGATYAEILLIGGGGGGGGGATGSSNGGGGGGDGTTERCLMFPANGEITFTIGGAGTGGAATANGTAGQLTEAAQGVATCNAPGGNFGAGGSGGGAGNGGAASSAGTVTGAAKLLYYTVGVAGSNGTSGAGGAGAGSSQFGGAGGNPSSGVGSSGDTGSAVLCAY